MDTGYQIEQINQFSVTSWYWKIVNGVSQASQPPAAAQLAWWGACVGVACAGACCRHQPSPSREPRGALLQINDLLGNSGSTISGSAATQQAPVVLGGSTDAELATGQTVQQQQGQPLAEEAVTASSPPPPANGTRR